MRAQFYESLIAEAFNNRGRLEDDFRRDAVHKECNYRVRMCEQLLAAINAAGGQMALQDVLRVARLASGHADYPRQLARYCVGLEEGPGTAG